MDTQSSIQIPWTEVIALTSIVCSTLTAIIVAVYSSWGIRYSEMLKAKREAVCEFLKLVNEAIHEPHPNLIQIENACNILGLYTYCARKEAAELLHLLEERESRLKNWEEHQKDMAAKLNGSTVLREAISCSDYYADTEKVKAKFREVSNILAHELQKNTVKKFPGRW